MVSTPVGWKRKTHELLLLEGKLALPAMQGKTARFWKNSNARAGKSPAPQERCHYNISAKNSKFGIYRCEEAPHFILMPVFGF
jgi:hypothetical protein